MKSEEMKRRLRCNRRKNTLEKAAPPKKQHYNTTANEEWQITTAHIKRQKVMKNTHELIVNRFFKVNLLIPTRYQLALIRGRRGIELRMPNRTEQKQTRNQHDEDFLPTETQPFDYQRSHNNQQSHRNAIQEITHRKQIPWVQGLDLNQEPSGYETDAVA